MHVACWHMHTYTHARAYTLYIPRSAPRRVRARIACGIYGIRINVVWRFLQNKKKSRNNRVCRVEPWWPLLYGSLRRTRSARKIYNYNRSLKQRPQRTNAYTDRTFTPTAVCMCVHVRVCMWLSARSAHSLCVRASKSKYTITTTPRAATTH